MILKRPLEMLAPNTMTDLSQIKQELSAIRQRGFCTSSQQRSVGVGAVAAPLFAVDGIVVGSLNVTGPVDRFTEDKVRVYSQLLRQACDRISGSLGSDKNHRR
jgi:DNA-binding IclR family transcriptional regulator